MPFSSKKRTFTIFFHPWKKGYEIVGPMRVDEISLSKLLAH